MVFEPISIWTELQLTTKRSHVISSFIFFFHFVLDNDWLSTVIWRLDRFLGTCLRLWNQWWAVWMSLCSPFHYVFVSNLNWPSVDIVNEWPSVNQESISRNQPTVCHSLRSPTLGSHVIVHVLGIPFLGFYSWDLTDRHKMNDSKNCPHNVESRNRQTFARKLFHFLFVLLVIILLTKNQLWD